MANPKKPALRLRVGRWYAQRMNDAKIEATSEDGSGKFDCSDGIARWPDGRVMHGDIHVADLIREVSAPKPARKRKAAKPVMAWGGYSDGKLHAPLARDASEPEYAVYRTRAKARKNYEDVRRVEIVEVRR